MLATAPPVDELLLVAPYPDARPLAKDVGRLSLASLKGRPAVLHLFTG